jgi:hypothetical protein
MCLEHITDYNLTILRLKLVYSGPQESYELKKCNEVIEEQNVISGA